MLADAKDSDNVVFIEVKTRKSNSFGQPVESINYRKRKKIINSAQLYMKRYNDNPPVRFDIISIIMDGKQENIEHIIDAFEI